MALSGWFAKARQKYLAIFQDADQDRVRNDLRTFFGPRADVYLAVYEKIRAGSETGRTFPRTWVWTVFFTSFPWFFYRRMYGAGATLVVLPIIFGLLFGSAGGTGSFAAAAMFAKTWYVHTALSRLRKADELGLTGAEREDYLRRAGGVSVIAGTLTGVLFAALLGLVIAAAFIGAPPAH